MLRFKHQAIRRGLQNEAILQVCKTCANARNKYSIALVTGVTALVNPTGVWSTHGAHNLSGH